MLYTALPTISEEAAAWGISADDYASPAEIDLWPDTEQAVRVFDALRTQWRVGFDGPTGLDYGAIAPTMDLMSIDSTSRPDLFDDLRVMERAALAAIRKKD